MTPDQNRASLPKANTCKQQARSLVEVATSPCTVLASGQELKVTRKQRLVGLFVGPVRH